MRLIRLGWLCVGLLLSWTWVTAQNEIDWQCPAEVSGQTLNIHNWTTYIAPDTISNFEALCGITVHYNEYTDGNDVLTALRRGEQGYDLVIADNTMISIMITEGLITEIDHTHIPNLKNLFPNFQNPSYDPQNRYSVPYQWGSFGIGYRLDKITTPPTSWEDFFEYSGQKAWSDFSNAMIGAALVTLGYSGTSQQPKEIAAARDYLIDHNANTLIVGDDQGQDLLFEGTVDMVVEYSGDIFQLNRRCDCENFAYVIPKEGANLWVDAMAITINSPNQIAAEAFMDFVLNPVVSAGISNFTAYATPNQAAVDARLIDRRYMENRAIYPDAIIRSRMFFLSDLTPEVGQLYDSAWDEILMLIGIENYQLER